MAIRGSSLVWAFTASLFIAATVSAQPQGARSQTDYVACETVAASPAKFAGVAVVFFATVLRASGPSTLLADTWACKTSLGERRRGEFVVVRSESQWTGVAAGADRRRDLFRVEGTVAVTPDARLALVNVKVELHGETK